MSLFQPIAIACQPGTARVDFFALAAGSGGPHTLFWLGPGSGLPPNPPPNELASWQDLGGEVSAIAAAWMGDGSALIVTGVGGDDRVWSNTYSAAEKTWSGWGTGLGFGVLHDLAVATS